MPRKIALLIPIILIVFISGCTVPGTDIEIPFIPNLWGGPVVQYENDVLVIKSIQAIPATIAPGQSTRIIAYVENRGSKTMPLAGTDKPTIELYDYCQGLFTLDGTNPYEITSLLPGEIKEVSWTLTAKGPDVVKLKTTCPPDGMKVRVVYSYKTTSLTTITFMQPTEMERRIQQGTLAAEQSYIVLGQGPVKPQFIVEDTQPVSAGSKKTMLSLQIKNQGGGFVEKSEIVNSNENIGITSSDDTANNNIQSQLRKCRDDDWPKPIKLIRKESPPLICEIDIHADIAKQIEATHTVETTIGYVYEFRDAVKVTVEPKT